MKIASLVLIACSLVDVPMAQCGQITVSPATISLKGSPGQATTQTFRVLNDANSVYEFVVDISDVQVKDGKRTFIPAEQSSESLASNSSTTVTSFELKPGEQQLIPVTFVLPHRTINRAVAVFFRGLPVKPTDGPRIRLNLGVVVDFSISNEVDLRVAPPQISPPSATANALITEPLANAGPEPANVRGVAVILDESGNVLGKAAFDRRRLLPGESDVLHAEYAGMLPPGRYRILCSLEYAGRTVTKTGELVLP
jgi:hypothetical protein